MDLIAKQVILQGCDAQNLMIWKCIHRFKLMGKSLSEPPGTCIGSKLANIPVLLAIII